MPSAFLNLLSFRGNKLLLLPCLPPHWLTQAQWEVPLFFATHTHMFWFRVSLNNPLKKETHTQDGDCVRLAVVNFTVNVAIRKAYPKAMTLFPGTTPFPKYLGKINRITRLTFFMPVNFATCGNQEGSCNRKLLYQRPFLPLPRWSWNWECAASDKKVLF